MAVIECPHVRDLIGHCEFDTIYHEHLCYFSVTALRPLFARHGLTLNDVRRLDIHGGSLRLYVSHRPGESDAVRELLRARRRRRSSTRPRATARSRRGSAELRDEAARVCSRA